MCELLGMSARFPAGITLSLNEFARHGGETGPHSDGWGVAFYEGLDANVVRESIAAANSNLMSTLCGQTVESEIVVAHIRKASYGPVELKNTHPFRRELGGRAHIFAHNGHLPGIRKSLTIGKFNAAMPIGNTDSEHAFCSLINRLSEIWATGRQLPDLSLRIAVVRKFAREMGQYGSANFLYSDGDVLFVYGYVRIQDNGEQRAPGLHYLTVNCNYGQGRSDLAAVEFKSKQVQQVTLVSTHPLGKRGWKPMQEGQLMVVQNGKIIYNEMVTSKAAGVFTSNYPDAYNRINMCLSTSMLTI